MKLSIYKTLRDIVALIALLIFVPLVLLVPGKMPWYTSLLMGFLVLIIVLLDNKAKKGVMYDERMVRVSGKSNMYALLITTGCAIVLGLLAKIYEPEWLTVPLTAGIIILVAVFSARIIFEIMIRNPDAEGKK